MRAARVRRFVDRAASARELAIARAHATRLRTTGLRERRRAFVASRWYESAQSVAVVAAYKARHANCSPEKAVGAISPRSPPKADARPCATARAISVFAAHARTAGSPGAEASTFFTRRD